MSPLECIREVEIVEAVAAGRWPSVRDEDLTEHLAGCAICREVALVAGALRAEHARALGEAHVPAPGIVWRRLTMRARAEAARRATRPITWVETVSAACGGLALVALSVSSLAWLPGWLDRGGLIEWLGTDVVDRAALAATLVQWSVPLALAVSAWLVFAPIAVYLALSDE